MQKECPIDFVSINENKVRLTALWVLLVVLVSLLLHPLWIFIFLSVDFFLRAFNFGKLSILNRVSNFFVRRFKIANKPIDQAPKRFAAGIGFALSLLIVFLLLAGLSGAVLILTIVFVIFALLESAFSFCAGCYIYTFLLHIKLIP